MAKIKIILMVGLIFTTGLSAQAVLLSRCLRQMFKDDVQAQCVQRSSGRTVSREESQKEEERAFVAFVCVVIGGVVIAIGYKLFGDGLLDYWPAVRGMCALGVMAVSVLIWCCSVFCRSCSGNRAVERSRRESLQREESYRTGLGLKPWRKADRFRGLGGEVQSEREIK